MRTKPFLATAALIALGACASGISVRTALSPDASLHGHLRHRAQPLLVVECRRAAHHCSRFYIMRDAALRCHDGSIAHAAVARNAHLPGQDHILANLRRARQTDLRANQ